MDESTKKNDSWYKASMYLAELIKNGLCDRESIPLGVIKDGRKTA